MPVNPAACLGSLCVYFAAVKAHKVQQTASLSVGMSCCSTLIGPDQGFLVSQRFNKLDQEDLRDPTAGQEEHSGSPQRNSRKMKRLSLLLCLVSVAITQGLMEKNDNELLRKIEKIRSLLNQHKNKHSSVDVVSKQTYEILREKLTLDSGQCSISAFAPVDIDMKLRSCKGSCSGYTEYQVDRESYVALGKQVKTEERLMD
ncbi:hypothetical protein XENOCAPTIV_001367 [Xenoophorus captivus]|uniref:Fibrinopeptide A n=1 Tax=Xenoophorus captivus TaxID=1517983 RepID=A0ABV0RN42_9TELE